VARARRDSDSRYSLRFATTAFILIAGTLVLVLYVLPERYVLRPGFRESGMRFPNPSTPFAPLPVVPVAAFVLPEHTPPAVILPGPAERFWAEVMPLLETGRYADALPVMEEYLLGHPGDADARREFAVALLADGRMAQAVTELGRLLSAGNDPAQRLLLARTLREMGRTDESVAEYARLAEARPYDVPLWLEWAQAYAWAQRYAEAARVLELALTGDPTSVPLRVELARTYYASGQLADARSLLAPIDENALAAAGALALRNDILAALYVPPPVPPTPSTTLEQALAAREADDFERARSLFQDALRQTPDDPGIWQAYADLLEYELADFEGARQALLEVERLGAPSAAVQYRLAQLDIWGGRMDEAERRLEGLLVALDAGGDAAVTRADVEAALGDLRRWEGDRLGAARRYEHALATDLGNARARAGMAALDAEVARTLVEVEQPRVGGSAYSLADTDDFARVDLGGEWIEVGGPWVWGGTAGNRWIAGVALDGADAHRQGAYLDLEAARWWRWGTLRTAVDFGVQRLRATLDPVFGASLGLRGQGGATSELRYERGPAYPIAVTLQSVLADVVQDRVSISHARPLGERWSLSATVDGAWLSADPDSVTGASAGVGRAQGALTLGRALSPSLTLGVTTRAVTFSRAAPVTTLPGGGSRRLFWDPSLVVAAGPYARLTRNLSADWSVTGTLGPGIAFIDERGGVGTDLVPHVSAEAGLRREGARYWTAFDVFYYQGQFDGYRTYGARLTLSARDFSSLGGAR
jgi:tetratricopeptide (TPR) repeat protein